MLWQDGFAVCTVSGCNKNSCASTIGVINREPPAVYDETRRDVRSSALTTRESAGAVSGREWVRAAAGGGRRRANGLGVDKRRADAWVGAGKGED